MPRRTLYTCDVCGHPKQVSNHWWVAESTNVGFHLRTWDWAVREGRLDDEGLQYVCGASCAHRLLDQFMGGNANASLEDTD